LITLKVDNDE